jgi:heat shock protein HslJ
VDRKIIVWIVAAAVGLALLGLVVVGVLVVLALLPTTVEVSVAQPVQEQVQTADPQHLLIPRWFLRGLVFDGREVPVAPDQQQVTLQFEENGGANGTSSCNNFFATYTAEPGGKMNFGPVGATKMYCDGKMDFESDYFEALQRVERFAFGEGTLVLSSEDGSTVLTFAMPPK